MRIQKTHYYVIQRHPGISGFQRWNEIEESIVTGHKARLRKLEIDREYLAKGLGRFRLHDGHLPEHCPVVGEVDMLRWLDANPFQEASRIN